MKKNNQANQSGLSTEESINCMLRPILEEKGYSLVKGYRFDRSMLRATPIDSNSIIVDFLSRGIPKYEAGLILSVKAYNSEGTADQKLPYHIEYEIQRYYPYPTLLLMCGINWSDDWKRYAERLCLQDKKWLIKVFFSFDELLLWGRKLPRLKGKNSKIYTNLPLFNIEDLPE